MIVAPRWPQILIAEAAHWRGAGYGGAPERSGLIYAFNAASFLFVLAPGPVHPGPVGGGGRRESPRQRSLRLRVFTIAHGLDHGAGLFATFFSGAGR
jgi:hypothetical protein